VRSNEAGTERRVSDHALRYSLPGPLSVYTVLKSARPFPGALDESAAWWSGKTIATISRYCLSNPLWKRDGGSVTINRLDCTFDLASTPKDSIVRLVHDELLKGDPSVSHVTRSDEQGRTVVEVSRL
jgi:hypothetical protein